MNHRQKIIFIAMATINTIMGLFPPWQQPFFESSRTMRNIGYDFIFTPPTEVAAIDLLTLLVQVAIVLFVCGSLIYYFKTPKPSDNNLDSQVRTIMSALVEGDVEVAVKAMKIIFNESRNP